MSRGGKILEPRVFLLPLDLYRSDRTVALLGDDDLGLACVLVLVIVVTVIVFLAVYEHYDIRVLLDGARFSEMAQPRARNPAIFRLTVELRHAQNRHAGFASQALQATCHPGNLFLTRRLLTTASQTVRFNQLQVVDHNQSQTTFAAADPPRRGSDLADGSRGRIVHE